MADKVTGLYTDISLSELSDAPDYTGGSLKFLRISEDETTVIYSSPHITELQGIPSITGGDINKLVRVDSGGFNLVYSTLSFLELNDTPSSFESGRLLRVDNTSTGVVLATNLMVKNHIGLFTDTPEIISGYTAGAGDNIVNVGGTRAILVAQGTESGALHLVDLGASAGNKWMVLKSEDGKTKFRSVNDNYTATIKDNILVLDHTTGYTGFGADPLALMYARKEISAVYTGVTPNINDSLLTVANILGAEATGAHASIGFNVNGGYHNRIGTISYVALSDSDRTAKFSFCIDDGDTRPEVLIIEPTQATVLGSRIVTESDYGEGNSLNADLLDGQHGSYYTGYTDTAVANIVNSAPETLDTLNELAAALGDDPNFATTVSNQIGTKLDADHDMTLTLDGDATGSTTFTDMGNATLTVVIANDSHTHDTRYFTETESDARFAILGHDHTGIYQPLDGDLTIIASFSDTSTGYLKKTGDTTWILDSSIGAGIYQPLDGDLTSIAGLVGTTGFLKKSAADTWVLDTSTYSISSHSHDGLWNKTGNDYYYSAGNVSVGGTPLATHNFVVEDTNPKIGVRMTGTGGGGEVVFIESSTELSQIVGYGSTHATYPRQLRINTLGTSGEIVLSSGIGTTDHLKVSSDGIVNFTNTPTVNGNTIWHAANDGSSSGLNADLLDGQHGSYYEPAFSKSTGFNKNFGSAAGTVAEGNHTHSYLLLAGGTLTGNLLNNGGQYYQTSGSGRGYYFWSSTSYGIYMSQATDATGGRVAGETTSDYNMYFKMLGVSRGFVFKTSNGNVAGVDYDGDLRGKDFHASRGNGTGVIYFGGTTNRYLYYDGTNYNFPGGNVYAPEFYRTSSRELKDNIAPLSIDALGYLDKTDFYEYTLKENGNKAIGFIAEDTDPLLSGKEQKGHNFGNHISLNSIAIKQLREEVSQLREKVVLLEAT